MKVCIVGANGKIGRILVDKMSKMDEFRVRAFVRKEEQAEAFCERDIEAVTCDLEDTVDNIAEALDGSDAVVFTAGSGSKTGPDKTLLVDLDGAVKTIEAAEAKGIKRIIMVSALQAHHRENWNERIRHYYVAKHYADRVLTASSLDYTIVRPARLLDEKGTGKIKLAENLERTSIPREDVADTIIACLKHDNTIRKGFDLISGETPIEEAVKNI